VGFSEAIKIVEKIKNKENLRLIKIRDNFFNKIKKVIPNVIINGDINSRLPNNIDISIPGEDGEMLSCVLMKGELSLLRQVLAQAEMENRM
jgi:cysteine desulfurase